MNRTISIDKAQSILSEINNWVKHADTKTSILLGFIAIFIGLSTTIFNSLNTIMEGNFNIAYVVFLIIFISIYILLSCGSIIFCLLSLLARLKIDKFNNTNSIIYFGNIVSESIEDYKSHCNSITEEELIDDYLTQIYINSNIAKRKYKFFNIALIFACSLLFITLILLLMTF